MLYPKKKELLNTSLNILWISRSYQNRIYIERFYCCDNFYILEIHTHLVLFQLSVIEWHLWIIFYFCLIFRLGFSDFGKMIAELSSGGKFLCLGYEKLIQLFSVFLKLFCENYFMCFKVPEREWWVNHDDLNIYCTSVFVFKFWLSFVVEGDWWDSVELKF